MKTKKGLYWAVFVAVLGSIIFGINMAAIAGAVPLVQEVFSLNDAQIGLVVSSIIIGCMVGAFTIGGYSEKNGRKNALQLAAVLFLISALGSSFSQNMWHLILARFIGGYAVGAVSVTIPTYISEITPPKIRGTLGSLNQLGVVVGILIAYAIDFYAVNLDNNWRIMLGQPVIIGIPFLLFMLINFPESPRWLVMNNKNEQALKVLNRLVDKEEANKELQDIEASFSNYSEEKSKKVKLGDIFKGPMGTVMFLGIMLAAFQQITGINAIIAYAPVIFEKTGVGGDTALLQSIILGVVNLVFTLVAVWLIDKVGRKQLLLWGSAGMVISLAYISYAFYAEIASGIGVFIAILSYIAFFAASLAPVMWVVTSEIYPNKIRGIAMAVSTAVSWVCTFLTVQFFPMMLEGLGGSVSFGFFLVFSLLAFVFILIKIPETKGKSLEQIQDELGLNVE